MDATVSLTGNVGADATLTQTRAGDPRAKFRVAVTPRMVRDGNWVDLETTWFTVVCYRALAENAAASVHRGDPVTVTGRLRTEVWADENNVEHSRLVVDARAIGHDLAHGTSEYRRSAKARVGEDPLGDEASVPADEEAHKGDLRPVPAMS